MVIEHLSVNVRISNKPLKNKTSKYVKLIDASELKTIRNKRSKKKTKREIFDDLRTQITEVRSINKSELQALKTCFSSFYELPDETQLGENLAVKRQDIGVSDEKLFPLEHTQGHNDNSLSTSLKTSEKNNLLNEKGISFSDLLNKTCYLNTKQASIIRNRCHEIAVLSNEEKTKLFFQNPSFRPLKISHKQEMYLEILRELNNEKFSLPCRCPPSYVPSIYYWFSRKGKIFVRNTRSIINILFDKNRGKTIYERAAFWPCSTEYFFYKTLENGTEDLGDTLNAIEDKTFLSSADEVILPLKNEELKMKIEKARKGLDDEGLFCFGFNHPCYRNNDPIRFFFINSTNNDTIACAFAKYYVRARYLVIFSHPNGTDLSDNIIGFPNLLDFARFMEVNLISYDYSGYGISNGIPNQETLVGNLQAILNYAKNVLKYPEERIILWGYSLGGAISSMVARNNKNIAGLILYGSPASIKAVVKTRIFNRKIVKDKYIKNTPFNTAEVVKEVDCPTLVIHSKKDGLISTAHALKIFQNAKTPVTPLLIDKAHHDYMDVSDQGWKKIREFIEYEIAFVHPEDATLSMMHPS
uniref:Hydrolase_4 domain-containing protein n=1 Tax=Parastrongyloides trichosuri TaxID=131310 RepID=A0A0N4ZMW3_PARTI